MGGHHGSHALLCQCGKGGDVVALQFVQAAAVFGQDVVAVAFHKSVSGEVFAARFHAAAVQAALQGECQFGDDIGAAVEAAVADDGALPPVQIQHGRER